MAVLEVPAALVVEEAVVAEEVVAVVVVAEAEEVVPAVCSMEAPPVRTSSQVWSFQSQRRVPYRPRGSQARQKGPQR